MGGADEDKIKISKDKEENKNEGLNVESLHCTEEDGDCDQLRQL